MIRLLINRYDIWNSFIVLVYKNWFIDDDFDELKSIWRLTLSSLIIIYLFYCLFCFIFPSFHSSSAAINLLQTWESWRHREGKVYHLLKTSPTITWLHMSIKRFNEWQWLKHLKRWPSMINRDWRMSFVNDLAVFIQPARSRRENFD